MKPKISILLAAILAHFCNGNRIQAAEVVDIRSGYHKTYSRLVIELDSFAHYNVVPDLPNRKVTVEISPITWIQKTGAVEIAEPDPLLDHVVLTHSGETLKITTLLLVPTVKLKTALYENPPRIVIDFKNRRQGQEAASFFPRNRREADSGNVSRGAKQSGSSIGNKAEENGVARPDSTPDTKRAPVSDLASDSQGAVTIDSALSATRPDSDHVALQANQDVLDEAKRLFAKETEPGASESGEDKPGGPGGTKGGLTTVLLVISTFILIDAILLTYYFINRKKGKRPVVESATDDGEKNPGPDFKDAVKEALQEQESQEEAEAATQTAMTSPVVDQGKMETIIRKLSDALESPALRLGPEFKDIARDIEFLDFPDSVPKEFWIGKDGAQFLKNRRRKPSQLN